MSKVGPVPFCRPRGLQTAAKPLMRVPLPVWPPVELLALAPTVLRLLQEEEAQVPMVLALRLKRHQPIVVDKMLDGA
eukprot:4491555-Pyramimonas_sp.AAC.1